MESGALASSKAVATRATGSAGTTAPTFAIRTLARRSTSAKRRGLIEHAEVDAALFDVLPQRQRLAEAHASIAEAIQRPRSASPIWFGDRAEQHEQIEAMARLAAGLQGIGVPSCRRSSSTRS